MSEVPRGRRWLLAMLFALAVVGQAADAWAQARQKQVLVLYSTRRDAQIAVVGDHEIPQVLANGLPDGLDYYSEFMDQARLDQIDYQKAFRDFLALKYNEHDFDLIVAMSDNALDFLEAHRSDLFSKVPIVFFSSSSSPRRAANATGVIGALNLGDTVALALELQPDLEQVFVIAGSAALDREYIAIAQKQFEPFQSRIKVTYLQGLATADLEARLKELPSRSIVYYMLVDRDGVNANMRPLDYLDHVASIANAPIYCWVDSAMQHGIVGGSLKSQQAQARAIADLSLRVLRGEAADSIPVLTPDLNVRQVDWRELRRWGISESRVPAGTLVRFEEPSLWDRYRVSVLAAGAVLGAQTVLIGGLLLQRSRRRQAEARLVASEAKLRASYEQISDLGGRLLQAQENERSHIARELHDDIGQQISLVVADLQRVDDAGSPDDLDRHRATHQALNRVHGLAKSVHDLSHRLHPAKLRLLGLPAALDSLRNELSQSGVSITFTHEHVPQVLPHELTLCVFRVVQESIQNAIKHGGAREILIHLGGSESGLTVDIVDDGVGFDLNQKQVKGLGLISMRERVEAVGGTLRIRSAFGEGTRLKMTVPFRATPSVEVAV